MSIESKLRRVQTKERMVSDIEDFWIRFPVMTYDPDAKLRFLKLMAERVYIRKKGGDSARRRRFEAHRGYKRLFSEKCNVCDSVPVIRHHIIPLKNGGNNSRRNIIPICSPCHSEIHPWLRELES